MQQPAAHHIHYSTTTQTSLPLQTRALATITSTAKHPTNPSQLRVHQPLSALQMVITSQLADKPLFHSHICHKRPTHVISCTNSRTTSSAWVCSVTRDAQWFSLKQKSKCLTKTTISSSRDFANWKDHKCGSSTYSQFDTPLLHKTNLRAMQPHHTTPRQTSPCPLQ